MLGLSGCVVDHFILSFSKCNSSLCAFLYSCIAIRSIHPISAACSLDIVKSCKNFASGQLQSMIFPVGNKTIFYTALWEKGTTLNKSQLMFIQYIQARFGFIFWMSDSNMTLGTDALNTLHPVKYSKYIFPNNHNYQNHVSFGFNERPKIIMLPDLAA